MSVTFGIKSKRVSEGDKFNSVGRIPTTENDEMQFDAVGVELQPSNDLSLSGTTDFLCDTNRRDSPDAITWVAFSDERFEIIINL